MVFFMPYGSAPGRFTANTIIAPPPEAERAATLRAILASTPLNDNQLIARRATDPAVSAERGAIKS
jgi:hypothetical protein